MNSKQSIISTLSCLLLLSCLATNASAGEILKCEKRINPPRSRVSVEVEDLVPGAIYTARVSSGANSKSASIAADSVGVAEYDFDSNPKDIRAGATPIKAKFIDGDVKVVVTDAMGAVVEKTSAACRIR
ncbi:MAG: hypothetical protein ACXWTS_03005 [Methylococcaceae bacterium]